MRKQNKKKDRFIIYLILTYHLVITKRKPKCIPSYLLRAYIEHMLIRINQSKNVESAYLHPHIFANQSNNLYLDYYLS